MRELMTNSEHEQHELQEHARPSQEELLERVSSIITGTLRSKLSEAANYKRQIETRWISDLRNYHGVYSPDVEGSLKNKPRSKLFINMTRPKTDGWAARLYDLLFPADDKNWGIKPTPVPELTDSAKNAARLIEAKQQEAMEAVEVNNQMVQEGQPPEAVAPVAEQAGAAASAVAELKRLAKEVQAELDEADKRASLMEREINDQFVEANYASICRDILDDACKLGVGILKGPVIGQHKRGFWDKGEGEQGFTYQQPTDEKPKVRRVNPWHFFPEDTGCIEDCEYTFERHMRNRPQLRKMAKDMGFDRRAVSEILKEQSKIDTTESMTYLNDLRSMTDENSTTRADFSLNRYVVWEYHGPLCKQDMMDILYALGRDEDAHRIAEEEDYEEQRVICYFCQDRVLKLAPDYPLDSGETLYSVFSFAKTEESILGGQGIPHLMSQEQAMLNSSVRMIMDHGGISAGPQVVVDKKAIQPTNGSWELEPFKAWETDDTTGKGTLTEPFKLHYITMNQAQLSGIITLALKFIDDVISLPMIAQGEQGQATQTLGGMSMLFNSANVIFRRVVKNWDDEVTAPTVRRFFDWNMQFSAKEEIKGDMRCEARGTSVLLVREVQSQQLMTIAMQWSQHPVIGPAIKVYELLSLTLQAMALSPASILVDADEFERRITAMAEAEAVAAEGAGAAEGQTPADEMRAQTSLQIAQITAESRLTVANIERETKIMELALRGDMKRGDIEAMLTKAKMSNDSAERKMAAEIGAETKAKREAEAMGMTIDGSGGAVNLAPQPAGAP